jgi:uncharacterized membrane protein
MELLKTISLILHIVCGYAALTAGLFVMLRKKGDLNHRRLGNIFFYTMLGVTISAIFLSIAKEKAFLLHVGLFVFYQNFAGWRSVKVRSLKPAIVDWLVLIIATINAYFMVTSGNVVLMVFGGITFLLVFTDLRIYYNLSKQIAISKLGWLARHLGMMMGAYIGAITAFLVVNVNNFEPAWLIWLAPTFILVPLMQYWTWKYTKKPLHKVKTIAA